VESACFHPPLIRRTAKRCGLSSESSYRFERGVDPNLADWASRRAVRLMLETAGGVAAAGVVDVYPAPVAARPVACRYGRVRDVIGMDLPAGEIESVFSRIGLGVTKRDERGCVVEVPTFRPDVAQEADLIEEVARIHGLDRIPVRAPACKVVSAGGDAAARALLRCREAAAGLGLAEVMNYSFTSERLLNLFDPEGGERRVRLPNPLSAEHAVLRPSLVPQMVETLGRNRARQVASAVFFEVGRVFGKRPDGTLEEREVLGLGLMGVPGRPLMDRVRPGVAQEAFGWLKGIIEALAAALRIPRLKAGSLAGGWIEVEPADRPWGEPGMVVSVRAGGEACGVMGLVKEPIRAEWRFPDAVAVAELELGPLLAHVFDVPAARTVPAYPAIERDVALLVAETVKHADIEGAIRAHAPKELTAIRLFDVYRGEGVGAGRKSMAYALTYRSMQRTLTDEEVNGYHSDVKAGITRMLHAEIRE